MSQHLEQQMRQQLTMRLTPLQVRFVRLLEMTRQEAEDSVDRELAVNPALEVTDNADDGSAARFSAANGDIPYYRLHAYNRQTNDETPTAHDLALMNASSSESLYDHLRRQLDERDLPPQIYLAADYIIGNLDTNGYLRRSVAGMVDDLAFSAGEFVERSDMKKALEVVHTLEPIGVGASGLQESMAMQLRAMPPSTTRDNALRIVNDAFEPLSMRHSHRIISQLKLKQDAYEEAIRLIQSLNPRPGASFGAGDADRPASIVPDFAVEEDEQGQLHVSIPSRIPGLTIDQAFTGALTDMEKRAQRVRAKKGSEKDAAEAYIGQMHKDASDFIDIWNQRRQTLHSVMTAIVKLQYPYFTTSDESRLRPMALRDIAELTGYDLSTISRATAGKYVATSWGIIPLRHLFSERMGSGEESHSDGDSVNGRSARSIQAAMKELVDAEDKRHPLSDEELTKRLVAAGHEVKRRTVAKYRELLGIPPSRLRKAM